MGNLSKCPTSGQVTHDKWRSWIPPKRLIIHITLQTEPLASFHSESWILQNAGIPVWSCLGFYRVVSNPFSLPNEVPNHSGPIFQHHWWLQLQSRLPHQSETFVSHLSVLLGGSLAFHTCERVLKLPASQVSQMAVPYPHCSNRDPTLCSTHSNSPRQCNSMNVTSYNRILKYSYCSLIFQEGIHCSVTQQGTAIPSADWPLLQKEKAFTQLALAISRRECNTA